MFDNGTAARKCNRIPTVRARASNCLPAWSRSTRMPAQCARASATRSIGRRWLTTPGLGGCVAPAGIKPWGPDLRDLRRLFQKTIAILTVLRQLDAVILMTATTPGAGRAAGSQKGVTHNMVRFLSSSGAALGWVRRRACSHRRMQSDVRALGRAQMHASGNRFDRERRLPPQARRDQAWRNRSCAARANQPPSNRARTGFRCT
jgi:hypothetical protein